MVIRIKAIILLLLGLSILSVFFIFKAIKVVQHYDGSVTATFISLFPLKPDMVKEKMTITSVDPRQKLKVKLLNTHFFKIAISVKEQDFPKGNPIMVRIEKLPTLIPGITKTFTGNLLPRIKPDVIKRPPSLTGTRSTLRIAFNTPLKKEKINELITYNFPAEILPQKINTQNKTFTDYASWEITPYRPLMYNRSYRITLQRGLASLSGETMTKSHVFHFTTVPELKIISIRPLLGSSGVPLITGIKVTANRRLNSGQVTVGDYAGETNIYDDKLSFTPARLFMPDSCYQATVNITDQYGETASTNWSFQTVKMGDQTWIDVNLRIPQSVTVYRGKQVLRTMKASSGKSKTPTPRGIFRVYDRGYAFYSYKFREGAYYWLRFKGPFLFHSVPFGPDYRIKPDEAAKLGQPSSHGCIRLSVVDAKWLYQNIANRTQVIIHGSPESQTAITNGAYLENTVFFKDEIKFNYFRKGYQKLKKAGQ